MSAHKKTLSPSGAYRWINCPGSHYIAQNVPPLPSTGAADEGTLAHAFAAYALYHTVRLVYPEAKPLESAPPEPEHALATEEMLDGAQEYAASVLSELAGHGGLVAFGVEVPLFGFNGRIKGRADFVAKTTDNTMLVVDYKFGEAPVPAVNNPQLELYTLLVEETLEHAPNPSFRVGIVQPRAVTSDFLLGSAVWDSPSPDKAYYSRVIDAAFESDENTLRTPGKHCQYCPARSICLAAVAEKLLLACTAAGEAERAKDASDEQVGRWLTAVKAVDKMADDLSRIAKARISAGATIPGWRISARKKLEWTIDAKPVDEQAADLAEVLKVDASELLKTSLKTPAEMKKTLPAEALTPVTREVSTLFLIAGK